MSIFCSSYSANHHVTTVFRISLSQMFLSRMSLSPMLLSPFFLSLLSL
jgi:hypothetical protein